MLVKRSQKNQIAIPKTVLTEAGLGPDDLYFDCACDKNGHIVLKPMQVEEKIPAAAVRRFEKKAVRRSAGDKVFASPEEGIAWLKSKK